MWNQKATLTGSAYSWGFLSSLTSVIGNYATLSVNQVCPHHILTIIQQIARANDLSSPTSHATHALA
jgi:hypothetical protein